MMNQFGKPATVILCSDSIALDAFDRVGDKIDVFAFERRPIVVRHQNPLTTKLKIGREPFSELGVFHLASEIPHRESDASPREDPRIEEDDRSEELAGPVLRQTACAQKERDSRQESPKPIGVQGVELADHPSGRALKDAQHGDDGYNARHDLNGTGPGSNDRDSLVREVDLVVPASGVHHLALELVYPGDVRIGRIDQTPDAGHDRARGERFAIVRREQPGSRFLIEASFDDFRVESHLLAELVLVDDAEKVLLDFPGRGVAPAPVGILLE